MHFVAHLQVSGSKIWQTERSCMCCQESGERVAVVSLDCPNANSNQPKSREVMFKNHINGRPVQDTFKKYLDTDTFQEKYLYTNTFNILSGKSI